MVFVSSELKDIFVFVNDFDRVVYLKYLGLYLYGF